MTETPDDQSERIKRWGAAQERALAEGITPAEAWTVDMVERKKATMGPNPTQEKARKLYEWWQSGSGIPDPAFQEMTQDIRSWANLHPYEQARWAMLAKALGDHPYHDHSSKFVSKNEELRGMSWADYDDVLHPKDPGYTKLRQRWWQLWRPRHEKLAKSSR